MKIEKMESLSESIHQWAIDKGFWDGEHSDEEKMVLVITELSEAVEADRKNRRADMLTYKNCTGADDILDADMSLYLIQSFEKLIKDTIEDELADAYIRLLDLGKARNIEFYDYSDEWDGMRGIAYDNFRNKSFPEIIHACMVAVLSPKQIETRINQSMISIVWICDHYGIDLERHIELKMEYNHTRERMHGKRY